MIYPAEPSIVPAGLFIFSETHNFVIFVLFEYTK
jgi:hypothetical protein